MPGSDGCPAGLNRKKLCWQLRFETGNEITNVSVPVNLPKIASKRHPPGVKHWGGSAWLRTRGPDDNASLGPKGARGSQQGAVWP